VPFVNMVESLFTWALAAQIIIPSLPKGMYHVLVGVVTGIVCLLRCFEVVDYSCLCRTSSGVNVSSLNGNHRILGVLELELVDCHPHTHVIVIACLKQQLSLHASDLMSSAITNCFGHHRGFGH
jgi:hypothetical protein